MGEGVIGFEEKTRNVHIIIISYLTVTQPLNLPTATSRKMLWLLLGELLVGEGVSYGHK